MNKHFLPLFLLILISSGFLIFKSFNKPSKISRAIINGQTFKLLIADTPKLRNRGLSYRESLSRDSGMLFIFEKKDFYSFWMNEMKFPLDFLWINDETIVDSDENIQVYTDGGITTVEPSESVNKVLEFNSGIIKKYAIKKGDKITFK